MPQVLHWIDTQVEHTLDERLSSTHGTIDIKLQVDPSLLADTYATLRISPSALLVRFETRHADIADLLCTHAASLAERLAQRTAKAASVEIAGLSESSNGSPTS